MNMKHLLPLMALAALPAAAEVNVTGEQSVKDEVENAEFQSDERLEEGIYDEQRRHDQGFGKR